MNLRNIFRRGQSVNGADNRQSVADEPEIREHYISHSQPSLSVPETGPESPTTQEYHSVQPWIIRDALAFQDEKAQMAQRWPQFQLEVIDDGDSPHHGSTCWSGKIKPGIYEDIEWELLVIYQGVGGGQGDWNGAIVVYFINPQDTQIVETLGYQPACMQRDSDGTLTLGNLRPIILSNLSAAEAIQHAFRVCQVIELMCIGRLPENTLRNNNFLLEENANNSQLTRPDNGTTNHTDTSASDGVPASPPAF